MKMATPGPARRSSRSMPTATGPEISKSSLWNQGGDYPHSKEFPPCVHNSLPRNSLCRSETSMLLCPLAPDCSSHALKHYW